MDQSVLLGVSYGLLMQLPSKIFSRYFRAQLSAAHPDVGTFFDAVDVERHERMIFTIFALAKEYAHMNEPHRSIPRLLGRKHRFRNVSLIHFQNYTHILLGSVAGYLGDRWTDEMNQLWTRLLEQLTLAMTAEFRST